MPAYNADKTIAYAIESVLCQSYEKFELIICNDASTDSTSNVINQIKDSRIIVLNNEKNMGEGYTRDRAISHATGQWITFIDSDDAWHPQRLEILLKESKPKHIVFDNLTECATAKNSLIKISNVRSAFCFGRIVFSPTVIELSRFIQERRLIMQPFFERELVTRNNIVHSQHTFGADTYFVLSMIKSGAKILYIPRALYFYRLTIGAASTNPKKIELMIDSLQSIKKYWHLSHLEDMAFNKKIEMLKKEMKYYNLISILKGKDKYDAISYLFKNPSLFFLAIPRIIFQSWKIILCKLNNAEAR